MLATMATTLRGRGITGNGFQPATIRANDRAFTVSVMLGNRRRSSMAAGIGSVANFCRVDVPCTMLGTGLAGLEDGDGLQRQPLQSSFWSLQKEAPDTVRSGAHLISTRRRSPDAYVLWTRRANITRRRRLLRGSGSSGCARRSWCGPAGGSPARVRRSEPPGSECCRSDR
jgi:hypothetical protein